MLGDLAKKAEDDEQAEAYANFWENFGAVLKEGLYEDYEHREQLLKLLRFRTTGGEGLVSLDDYVGRMKEGQDAIFYISGDDIDTLRRSPQIEGFKARGVEVLLLTDPVDEFWIPSVAEYKEKKFKSVPAAAPTCPGSRPRTSRRSRRRRNQPKTISAACSRRSS